MSIRRPFTPLAVFLLAVVATSGCVVTTGSANPISARTERVIEESVAVEAGEPLRIYNLAGRAELTPVEGSEVTVRATVRAGGDSESEAEQLAGMIELRVGRSEGDPALTVVYPVHEYGSYHYDDGQDGGIASWFGGSNSRFDYMDERVRVSTTRRPGAASVHADLEIGVPAGVAIRLLNAVGQASATAVDGDLTLVVHSGRVEARGGAGALTADTGSGSVRIEDREGSVLADTGSGSVTVRGVRGEVRIDTGSGSVTVQDVEGPFVGVDTGSGSVDLSGVSGALDVDTGSGGVTGDDLVAGARLRVDTGSGRVRLTGDFAALERGEIDTGSGGVTLRMSAWPSMRLDLRTSSGGIDVELPEVRAERSERDAFRGQVGESPTAELQISTGSGGIRISER